MGYRFRDSGGGNITDDVLSFYSESGGGYIIDDDCGGGPWV